MYKILAKQSHGSLSLQQLLNLAEGYRLEDIKVSVETEQGVQNNTIGGVYLVVKAKVTQEK